MKPGTEIAIEPPRCECCAAKCRILARIEGYTYWQCNACGYTFLPETADEGYTQRLYSDAYFFDGAFGYADYVAERALQRRHGAEFGRLLKRYARPGRILDVGCASGSMLQGFSDEGWSGEGMEPNATLAAIAREATGLPVYTQAMEDHLPALHRRFDAIAMIQVIAHFRSLTGALENAARYLRSNGLLLVETWNPLSVTARIMGSQWHELSPPATLRILTPSALDVLAGRAGFSFAGAGRPRKRILASHAKSLLEHKRQSGGFSAMLAALVGVLPDTLPMWYPAEDAYWRLYSLLLTV